MGQRIVYVTYDEAQILRPYFEAFKKSAPYPEARASAIKIVHELDNVRDIDYRLGGYQMFLNETEYDFYIDTLNALKGMG